MTDSIPPPSPNAATAIIDLGSFNAEQVREHLGSKEKFWMDIELDGSSASWMFKHSKIYESTGQIVGDHWSEHLASRLFLLAGVPAHETRMARDTNGNWGVLCRSVLTSEGDELVHGAELLERRAVAAGKEYRADKKYPEGYDVAGVFRTLQEHCGEAGGQHLADIVLMDAWLRNTDRHDENWGIIRSATGEMRPCPAYDNASTMGRSLTPVAMGKLLAGQNHGIEGFLNSTAGHTAFTYPGTTQRLSHEDVLQRLVSECNCANYLESRLDIIAGMQECATAEVKAVLGAAGCGDTELRFVLALLDQSLQRITRCLT